MSLVYRWSVFHLRKPVANILVVGAPKQFLEFFASFDFLTCPYLAAVWMRDLLSPSLLDILSRTHVFRTNHWTHSNRPSWKKTNRVQTSEIFRTVASCRNKYENREMSSSSVPRNHAEDITDDISATSTTLFSPPSWSVFQVVPQTKIFWVYYRRSAVVGGHIHGQKGVWSVISHQATCQSRRAVQSQSRQDREMKFDSRRSKWCPRKVSLML